MAADDEKRHEGMTEPAPPRQERMAAALRANLRKRKAQQRQRAAATATTGPAANPAAEQWPAKPADRE